jgi:malate synthase
MSATGLGWQVSDAKSDQYSQILSDEALEFIKRLHQNFEPRRQELLLLRKERQKELDGGSRPIFLKPNRRVEITGPAERKMIINAMNSGANVFMADIEDSLSPTWTNILQAQLNLYQTVRRTITFTDPNGKTYKLQDKVATLVVRPRGWHLDECHITIDGKIVSASLFDFGLYFFHNAHELIERKSGPYFYLPKLENHVEARLWNDVFNFAQDQLKIPRGQIRATVLLETILAAFEMDEILYELRDHASGLNAGRWDYIFSMIKKFRNQADFVLPDRNQITMTVPFMKCYADLIVKTCHKREAHAMGGMAAFIPSRKDEEINRLAIAKVTEDKKREAASGFDGTWVAHPDLVQVAKKVFDETLGDQPHQKSRLRDDLEEIKPEQLLDLRIENGAITLNGIAGNIDVALQYINSWLEGIGAAAIHNLMEDAATAEISRAQLWQWIKNRVQLQDNRIMTADLYREIADKIFIDLSQRREARFAEAKEILDDLVLSDEFIEFLTLPAYAYLKN